MINVLWFVLGVCVYLILGGVLYGFLVYKSCEEHFTIDPDDPDINRAIFGVFWPLIVSIIVMCDVFIVIALRLPAWICSKIFKKEGKRKDKKSNLG